LAGLIEDSFRLVGQKSPIGRDTVDKYTEDIAVNSQLIQRELGFKPQFDLKTGWQKTVQEMQRMGLL
jgi:nucleoside-diphosphate-sugar epimerase